jgi:hypothetical protein
MAIGPPRELKRYKPLSIFADGAVRSPSKQKRHSLTRREDALFVFNADIYSSRKQVSSAIEQEGLSADPLRSSSSTGPRTYCSIRRSSDSSSCLGTQARIR